MESLSIRVDDVRPRYLTKSRFKLAMECPTKLFYTGKKEFPSTKLDDSFLQSLASGGHQVGELAKCYYPDGVEVTSLDYEEAEKQTLELLERDEVTIFEPAIRFRNLFIRIDILVKKGNHFDLIEVKAKSYSESTYKDIMKVNYIWKPYIRDVAFQKVVLQGAFPASKISSHLLLVDKNAICPTNGLHQKFKIVVDDFGRRSVSVNSLLTDDELSQKLLKKVCVDQAVQSVIETKLPKEFLELSFVDNIHALETKYVNDTRISEQIGTKCKKCEFRCSTEEERTGKKSGFKDCWKSQLGWTDNDFQELLIFDLWDNRSSGRQIKDGKYKLKDLCKADLKVNESTGDTLTRTERQWLQLKKYKENDTSEHFAKMAFKEFEKTLTYPLHFIDFETSKVAIPFYKGMRPYELIAFQFSHHILHTDGQVEHAGEFLQTKDFPNFNFVRELKNQLEKDNGSIFMFYPHESRSLLEIMHQLESSEETDKYEIIGFIKSVTESPNKSSEQWKGNRQLIDLLELVKEFYYHSDMKGSNSIKNVLPAILSNSQYLKDKYSDPIYGTGQISSLNFKNKTWVEYDNDRSGKVIDPYKNLPNMFNDISEHDVELLSESDELNNGGLALAAYGKLQFTEMSDYEREELKKALLMYCELDTFAMVVIFEAWRAIING